MTSTNLTNTRPKAWRARLIASICAPLLLTIASGCQQKKELEVPPAPKDKIIEGKLEVPKARDLTAPPEGIEKSTLALSEPKLWGECKDLFEPDGEQRTTYPYHENNTLEAEAFFGCELEGMLKLDDGRRFVAYALEPEKPSSNTRAIRVVAYDKQGKRVWTHDTERDARGTSFAASYRGTTLANVEPYLFCVSSMWESGIDIECLKTEDGESAWKGRLPYWSGISPQGFAKSLFVADLSGLRQIYPWSGVERRFKKLDGPGGRSSFYATDGERLYYSSNRTAPLTLGAYDFEKLEQIWSRELPGKLDPIWSEIFPEHKLLVLRQEETLVGVSTTDGKALWAVNTGESTPKIASNEDSLFVLVRRKDKPNLLHAIDPKSGQSKWWTEPPTGTLRIEAGKDQVVLGSVRAVQRATVPPAAEK